MARLLSSEIWVLDLVAQLARERFDANQGDAIERAYRKGWNDRSESLARLLHAEQRREAIHERFDLGGGDA